MSAAATRTAPTPLWQLAAAVGLALVLLTNLGTGLLALRLHSVAQKRPDPTSAYDYVAAHHVPGEPTVTDWPPFANFVLGDHPDLRFLVGPEWRLRRYTRPVGTERLTDLYLGAEAVASAPELCQLLATHPGTRLVPDVVVGGAIPEGSVWNIVPGAAEEVFRTTEGVPVFHSITPASWTGEARQRCQPPGAGAEDPA
jgi:hypothetical protein